MGIARDGSLKSGFTRGIELRGKYTLIAEGARGSLAKELIARFGLDNNREPQKFGIGLKELWRIDPLCTGLASSSIPSGGRWMIAPAAARSSIISKTISSPLVSWFT